MLIICDLEKDIHNPLTFKCTIDNCNMIRCYNHLPNHLNIITNDYLFTIGITYDIISTWRLDMSIIFRNGKYYDSDKEEIPKETQTIEPKEELSFID